MKDIILFGAGKKLRERLKACRDIGNIRVVEIWDHHPNVSVFSSYGVSIPVCLPHAMEPKLPVYIIPLRFEQEIRRQLREETNLDDRDIFSWMHLFDGYREEMICRYRRSQDAQLRKSASFMERNRELRVFNDEFADEYLPERMKEPVSFDEEAGLWYTDWHGRRLYMKRGATQKGAEDYFRGIRKEQDPRSPHHYPVDWKDFPADVVIDCGAAEGFFALDAVAHAKEIYLIEGDPDWIEALQHTFAGIEQADVHIIHNFVGGMEDEDDITIDSLALTGKRLLVKMDVEGAELDALDGMKRTMERNEAIRVLACAYHRHGDAAKISAFLLDHHFEVRYADGYMWFPYERQVMAELRHGLVIGERRRKHVYLWGAGQKLQEVYDCINTEECVVDGIVDSHADDCQPFRSYRIQTPDILKTAMFDAVIVTAKRWKEIASAYETIGCPKEKLVCFWKDDDAKLPLFCQDRIRLHEAERLARVWKNRALNAPFEYAAKEDVHILDGVQLLQKILRERCSLSRFGDGEFSLILQEARPWFQAPDPKLGQKLRQVLEEHVPNLVVAIADNYGNLEKYTDVAADGIRSYQIENQHRMRTLEMFDDSRIYYDTYVTRPYLIYRDKSWSKKIFSLWKRVFENRNILIVEGRLSRFGCGSDLLAGVASVRRILAPEKDAFRQYDQLLASIHRHARQTDLILISLGPTATVLASAIAKWGIQAVDIGQLDNEYDWYRMGAETRVQVPGKMTAEASQGRSVNVMEDKAFDASVIERCY